MGSRFIKQQKDIFLQKETLSIRTQNHAQIQLGDWGRYLLHVNNTLPN